MLAAPAWHQVHTGSLMAVLVAFLYCCCLFRSTCLYTVSQNIYQMLWITSSCSAVNLNMHEAVSMQMARLNFDPLFSRSRLCWRSLLMTQWGAVGTSSAVWHHATQGGKQGYFRLCLWWRLVIQWMLQNCWHKSCLLRWFICTDQSCITI